VSDLITSANLYDEFARIVNLDPHGEEHIRRTAYHEASHAVVAVHLGLEVEDATIKAKPTAGWRNFQTR
jgi:hypothetical protein